MSTLTAPLKESENYNKIVEALQKNPVSILTDGCAEAQKLHLIHALAREESIAAGARFRLIVTYSDQKAREIQEDFRFYDRNTVLFPAKDLIFYQADLRGRELDTERIRCLRRIMEGRPATVVTTFAALMTPQVPLSVLQKSVITVEKSEEPYRAVFVVVWGNTPNGALIERAFWVRQYSTEIVPTVDPDLLVFPLEGGEKTAAFNKADYPYSGVYVSEEGKKWAHAEMDSKGVVTVTVDATTDEQGRGCSVVCWADNSPTPSENAVLVPITVKQVKPEIKKIYFKTFNKVHSEIVRYHEDEPDNFWNWLLMDATAESHEMDLMVTKDNFTIKTSIDGNTMHVDCVGSAQKFGTTQKATLSFDVVNYNAAKPDKAMVTNVKMTNDVTMNAGGGSASMNMKVNVDNIPVWNLSPLYIASAGTVANGVKFSNFYDVISVPDGKATGYYEEDNGNNALLRISFEGNDNDDWTDVVDLEDWGDDDDDDDDWGDWSRSTEKQARQKRVHSALERRLLQQLKKIKKQ